MPPPAVDGQRYQCPDRAKQQCLGRSQRQRPAAQHPHAAGRAGRQVQAVRRAQGRCLWPRYRPGNAIDHRPGRALRGGGQQRGGPRGPRQWLHRATGAGTPGQPQRAGRWLAVRHGRAGGQRGICPPGRCHRRAPWQDLAHSHGAQLQRHEPQRGGDGHLVRPWRSAADHRPEAPQAGRADDPLRRGRQGRCPQGPGGLQRAD